MEPTRKEIRIGLEMLKKLFQTQVIPWEYARQICGQNCLFYTNKHNISQLSINQTQDSSSILVAQSEDFGTSQEWGMLPVP